MEQGSVTQTAYDSTFETMKHIIKVRENISMALDNLLKRSVEHDKSKLGPEEKPLFDEMTPLLEGVVFGSEEYTEMTKRLKPALDHHYAVNDHHPQFFGEEGINGMSLLSLTEMICDWKAAGERGKNGNIFKSISIQQARFGISKQLFKILVNTALELWPEEYEKFVNMEQAVESNENNSQSSKEA